MLASGETGMLAFLPWKPRLGLGKPSIPLPRPAPGTGSCSLVAIILVSGWAPSRACSSLCHSTALTLDPTPGRLRSASGSRPGFISVAVPDELPQSCWGPGAPPVSPLTHILDPGDPAPKVLSGSVINKSGQVCFAYSPESSPAWGGVGRQEESTETGVTLWGKRSPSLVSPAGP